MSKKVQDILTCYELNTIEKLKEKIKNSSNNTHIFYYKRAINNIIKNAKGRYYETKKVAK